MKIKNKSNKAKNNKNLTHEIVIGLVAGVGTDLVKVTDALSAAISPTSYETKIIQISKCLCKQSKKIDQYKIEEINARIDVCNAFRKKSGRPDAIAILAASKIKQQRAYFVDKNLIYIIRQLKNPHEVKTLRKIYGKNFILISIYDHEENRRKFLNKHNKGKKLAIKKLILRDEKEENKFGQNTRGAFVEADYFIPMDKLEISLKRFTEILFGYLYHTPTKDELNMACAWNYAARSADLSRQVGAMIANQKGDLLASGCNEVPKFGGGAFWEGDSLDYRDFTYGKEPNDARKELIIKKLIKATIILSSASANSYYKSEKNKHKILKDIFEHLTKKEEILKIFRKLKKSKADIFNIIEYHRAVHAEEAAICDAARRGISIKDATLYSTTCPCHLCTKHIIAAGIKKVIYIHPYPKSQTGQLFTDLVAINPNKKHDNKVIFKSFMGVAPRRMLKVFYYEPDKRKENGKTKPWVINKASSPFLSRRTPLAYYDKESAYITRLSASFSKIKKISDYIFDKEIRKIFSSAKNGFSLHLEKESRNLKQAWASDETKEDK